MLKIGVLLPSRFEDAGDFLADARALDAAGADSLWIDGDGHEPWLILAAIASVTGQVRLVAPVAGARAAASLESDVRTLDRLSRGRLVLRIDGPAISRLPAPRTRSDTRPVPVFLAAEESRGGGVAGSSGEWSRVHLRLARDLSRGTGKPVRQRRDAPDRAMGSPAEPTGSCGVEPHAPRV